MEEKEKEKMRGKLFSMFCYQIQTESCLSLTSQIKMQQFSVKSKKGSLQAENPSATP